VESSDGKGDGEQVDATRVVRRIGRYVIKQRIAEGGMGTVYLAHDPNIARTVAVKVLRRIEDNEVDLLERFDREARAAGGLSHPNIVRVYDYGRWEGAPFLVMEYIEGETLAKVVARRANLPLATRIKYLEDLCAGLGYAHRRDVVHRDIKPANLIVDEEGTVKILDFGLARIANTLQTHMSVLAGTPAYMPPEQIRGETVDQRGDIFSAGAVAYELLTFKSPFKQEGVSDASAIMYRIVNEDQASMRSHDRSLPPELDQIVERALSKRPDSRYGDAGQMRAAFERVRLGLERSVLDWPSRGLTKSRSTTLLLGSVAMLLLGIATWTALHFRTVPSTTTPATPVESPRQVPTDDTTPPPASASMVRIELPRDPSGGGRAFWMDRTEVTNGQYQKFVLANPAWQKDRADVTLHDGDYLKLWTGNDFPPDMAPHPVVYVSLAAAQAYAQWAGKRLPTEAEWEYAARAGSRTAYWWGDVFLDAHANRNARGTEAVGDAHRVNAFGLADMAGNVWEWTQPAAVTSTATTSVVKGGSWKDDTEWLRTDARVLLPTSTTGPDLGFRCVSDSVTVPREP
jgi:serine/threonine protein kinase